ncbi:cyclase family protein [Streptomyces sp. SID3343]|uniref:cyclase family protein n=1 Tax=Streptomyces sp. SID3343 TaxID=2690260 RepID=UPI00136EE8B9|nr:cyclase family protein [Streptomyces sp. SID3343]
MTHPSGTVVDLTMPISHHMPAYPGEPTAVFETFSRVETDDVAMTTVHLFSQLGTHIDAPAHFTAGTRTVDRLDLARCIGPAHLVRLGTLAPGAVIDTDTLRRHADVLAVADRVVFSTGWSRRAGGPGYFRDWPVFTEDAAAYLASHAPLFVGLDTPSPGDDRTNPAIHRRLFADETALVECLVSVDDLPDTFEIICLPLPLVGLDGAPVRAVARI